MSPLRYALRDLAVLGLALICGVAALAAQGGRWNHRLDLLTHFAPVWLVGGLTGLLLAMFVRPSRMQAASIGSSLAAVLSAGGLMWVDLAPLVAQSAAASPTGRTLKVIEFNAWARNVSPQRTGEWLAQEDPDVVVIPESSPVVEAAIAARTRLHIFNGSGALIATRATPLSKHVAWEARGLPGAPTEFTWVELPGPDGRAFTVVGVHCGWPIPSRYAWGQDRNIAALLGMLDRSSVILTGDFNSTQWSFRQRTADAAFGIARRDRAAFTWPARLPMFGGRRFAFPFLSIDHIYAGSSWRTVSVTRGPSLGSDHYPLIASLALSR